MDGVTSSQSSAHACNSTTSPSRGLPPSGRRSDAIVAVFPVGHNDQIMLVTDGGMVIRCPVYDIRIARRRSQGVVIFKVGDGERVVSVARLPDESENNGTAEGLDDTAHNQEPNEGDT